MAIADSSLTSLRDAVESVYGTFPAAVFKERRLVNESLGQDKEIVQSDELAPDRMSNDNIQVGSAGSGDHVAELTGGGLTGAAFNTWDDYWLSALGATAFSTAVGGTTGGATPGLMFSAGTITPANSGNDDITLTISGGTPAVWNPALVAGEFIYFSGFTGVLEVLNTIYQVKSGAGTATLTLNANNRVPASPPTAAANTLGAFQIPSCTNANVSRSWSIERAYSIASNYGLLTGMTLAGFDVEMRPKRPMRVTWRWIGKEERHKANQSALGVTAAVTSRKSFSIVSDMRGISLDGDGHSFFLNSFTLSVKNGAYAQDERGGFLGAVGVGLGTMDITGSYEFYYDDTPTGGAGTIHQQLFNFTDKNLAVMVGNIVGDSWCVHLPRINWIGGRRNIAGKDQATKGVVQFRAVKPAGSFWMIRIARA